MGARCYGLVEGSPSSGWLQRLVFLLLSHDILVPIEATVLEDSKTTIREAGAPSLIAFSRTLISLADQSAAFGFADRCVAERYLVERWANLSFAACAGSSGKCCEQIFLNFSPVLCAESS